MWKAESGPSDFFSLQIFTIKTIKKWCPVAATFHRTVKCTGILSSGFCSPFFGHRTPALPIHPLLITWDYINVSWCLNWRSAEGKRGHPNISPFMVPGGAQWKWKLGAKETSELWVLSEQDFTICISCTYDAFRYYFFCVCVCSAHGGANWSASVQPLHASKNCHTLFNSSREKKQQKKPTTKKQLTPLVETLAQAQVRERVMHETKIFLKMASIIRNNARKDNEEKVLGGKKKKRMAMFLEEKNHHYIWRKKEEKKKKRWMKKKHQRPNA